MKKLINILTVAILSFGSFGSISAFTNAYHTSKSHQKTFARDQATASDSEYDQSTFVFKSTSSTVRTYFLYFSMADAKIVVNDESSIFDLKTDNLYKYLTHTWGSGEKFLNQASLSSFGNQGLSDAAIIFKLLNKTIDKTLLYTSGGFGDDIQALKTAFERSNTSSSASSAVNSGVLLSIEVYDNQIGLKVTAQRAHDPMKNESAIGVDPSVHAYTETILLYISAYESQRMIASGHVDPGWPLSAFNWLTGYDGGGWEWADRLTSYLDFTVRKSDYYLEESALNMFWKFTQGWTVDTFYKAGFGKFNLSTFDSYVISSAHSYAYQGFIFAIHIENAQLITTQMGVKLMWQ